MSKIVCEVRTSRLNLPKIILTYSGLSGELLTILDKLMRCPREKGVLARYSPKRVKGKLIFLLYSFQWLG